MGQTTETNPLLCVDCGAPEDSPCSPTCSVHSVPPCPECGAPADTDCLPSCSEVEVEVEEPPSDEFLDKIIECYACSPPEVETRMRYSIELLAWLISVYPVSVKAGDMDGIELPCEIDLAKFLGLLDEVSWVGITNTFPATRTLSYGAAVEGVYRGRHVVVMLFTRAPDNVKPAYEMVVNEGGKELTFVKLEEPPTTDVAPTAEPAAAPSEAATGT